MADDLMTIEEMFFVRKIHGLTQTQAAEMMGLGLRAYQLLEGGKTKIRRLHSNAFRWGILHEKQMRVAVEAACEAMANSWAN